MQTVKKTTRIAAAILLAVLIAACSIVLPGMTTTASAASSSLTSIGLAEHVLKAYREGWVYSYGAYGDFNSNGVRATDCSGLIYSYLCWVDDSSNIKPNWNYPRTVTAQANASSVSGSIDTIPRTHGLIVTIANYDHVGVYVGNGKVIDNSTWGVNMRYESVKTNGWIKWHKLDCITYPMTGWYKFDGDYFYYENGEYIINTTRTIDGVTYTFGSDGVSDKSPSNASNSGYGSSTSDFNAKTTAGVRLREGPGLNYNTLTVLAEGTSVNVTSTKNAEWYAVTTGSGQKGYVYSEYLKLTGSVTEEPGNSGAAEEPVTASGEAAKTTTGVHLRSGRGTNYSSLGVISGGTAITVTDKSDSSWYGVTVNGKSGYMFSEYIKLDSSSNSGSTTEDPSASESTAAKTTTDVHLRGGRGTKYSSLGVISGGTAVTVTDRSDSSCYGVTVNGKSGYMFSQYIKLDGSTSGTGSVAVGDTMTTTAYLNLRKGAGTDTSVLLVIPEGGKVAVVEKTSAEWYKVTYGGQTGYVSTSYVR